MALAAFAAVTVPLAAPSSLNPARKGRRTSGLDRASIGKKVKGDVALRAPGRYKSQGPFALKGWNAHGISGSVSLIELLCNTFQVLNDSGD
jgi:hypothetical protein